MRSYSMSGYGNEQAMETSELLFSRLLLHGKEEEVFEQVKRSCVLSDCEER
jgi:hypothetical protein